MRSPTRCADASLFPDSGANRRPRLTPSCPSAPVMLPRHGVQVCDVGELF